MSGAPEKDWIAAAETFVVAKDRAKRFAFRIGEVARERSLAYAGERVGMTSFAEAGPVLAAVVADLDATVDGFLAGKLRDRERGETEIPLVVALEGVRERVQRAIEAEAARLARRGDAARLQRRVVSLLEGARARLDAFAAVYEAKRMVPEPAPLDLDRLLARVEEDAAADAAPRGPHADALAPRVVSAAEPLEDLLRAARAEVAKAPRPWRVRREASKATVTLSIGAEPASAPSPPRPGSPPSLLGPRPEATRARERTDRAAEVLALLQGVEVSRTTGSEGAPAGVAVVLEDAAARAVGERVAPEAGLSSEADAAVRAYLRSTEASPDPMAPARLVGAMGLFRAVERETERVLLGPLSTSEARVAAGRVPREASRKAPVRREVADALAAAYPAFPVHRLDDVLSAVAAGKATAAHARPPDAAVVLAVLGRSHGGPRPFGERALPLGTFSDADVDACVRDVSTLSVLRLALDRGRSPGPGWEKALEDAAFGLLRRLARVRPASGG